MPVLQKSMQTLFVETVLIISLLTLVGHLSVNFWERYVVQNELSDMKASLHALKNTIYHISNAYHQIYKELHTLAAEAVKENFIDEIIPDKYDQMTHFPALAENVIENIEIKSMLDKSKDLRKIQTVLTQTTANEDTQTDLNKTTSYNPPPNLKVDYKDKNVGDKGFHNKKIQYITRIEAMRKKHNIKNVTGTSMTNSLKSTAAKTKLHELQDADDAVSSPKDGYNKYHVRENVYKCKNNHCCTAVDNDYSYL